MACKLLFHSFLYEQTSHDASVLAKLVASYSTLLLPMSSSEFWNGAITNKFSRVQTEAKCVVRCQQYACSLPCRCQVSIVRVHFWWMGHLRLQTDPGNCARTEQTLIRSSRTPSSRETPFKEIDSPRRRVSRASVA